MSKEDFFEIIRDSDEEEIHKKINIVIDNMDTPEVFELVKENIISIALVSFWQQLEKISIKLMGKPDGVECLRHSWKKILNNATFGEMILPTIAKDDEIRKDILSNIPFILKYGIQYDNDELVGCLFDIYDSQDAIANNFDELLADMRDHNFDKLVLPAVTTKVR